MAFAWCEWRRIPNGFSGLVEGMRANAIPQFGLEPSAFGRHDAAGVGNSHQIFDACGIERKSACILAALDKFFQLPNSSNASHEIDPLAGAGIFNAENRGQNMFLQQGSI